MSIKIAVYSIALNEIKHVERYAAATAGADYVIVADTGSTDGTQEALRKLGVTVYDISVNPWRFDMARNAALSLVPKDADVCLVLDLDEVPEPKFFDKVRKRWTKGSDFGWITIDTGSKSARDRLHGRNGWHWKYPCHEIQLWYGQGEAKQVDITNALITHMPDNSKSRGQYISLLEMAVKEFPDDARMWTYMAREYYYHNRWEDVLAAGKRRLELDGWDVEGAATCRWMGEAAHQLGQDATQWFEKGVEILPTQGEPWHGVAIDAYRKQQWQKCLDACLTIIDLPRSAHYCYEAPVWDWKALDLAGVSAYNLGHKHEALTFAKEAAKANGPEQERILRNIHFMKQELHVASTRKQGNQVGNG